MMTVQVLLYSKAERGILLLDYYNVWVIEKVVWSKKLSELCSKTKKQFNFFDNLQIQHSFYGKEEDLNKVLSKP